MIAPVYKIEVDDRNLMLHVDALPLALRTRLRETVTRLTDELLTRVRATEPKRTGQLQSLTRSFVDENENSIRGRVRVLGPTGRGHNVAAAALEYGAHRALSVRAYERQSIAVRAYQRHANIAARRFLRDPAEAIRDRAMAELQKAVDDAVRDANR